MPAGREAMRGRGVFWYKLCRQITAYPIVLGVVDWLLGKEKGREEGP